jgi:hypothetical protein
MDEVWQGAGGLLPLRSIAAVVFQNIPNQLQQRLTIQLLLVRSDTRHLTDFDKGPRSHHADVVESMIIQNLRYRQISGEVSSHD